MTFRQITNDIDNKLNKKISNKYLDKFNKSCYNLDIIKRGSDKLKKQFASSLEEGLLEEFKKTCSDYGVAMNTVLEVLIKDFCEGNYTITIKKNGTKISRD